MKNYALSNEEKKEFILGYKILESVVDEKRIVIRLATGENYVVPYSIENEQIILMKMKKQVLDVENFLMKMFGRKLSSCILSFVDLSVVTGIVDLTNLPHYFYLIPSVLIIKNMIIGMNAYIREQNAEKSKKFLDNEELFIKENMNENVLNGVSKKARIIIDSKDKINLNDIDKFKYKDVRRIADNIIRDKKLGLNYETKKLVRK